MFYCPKCKVRVFLEVDIKDIPADYSTNILTNSINLVLCSIGNYLSLDIKGFRCPNCATKIGLDEVYIKSCMSETYDILSNFLIVSIKNKNDKVIDGRIALVIPPKVIHQEDLEKFKKSNPYNDDKYLIINPVSGLNFLSPK